MKEYYYIAGDYAGLKAGGFDFYFGYEETVDEEWAFVAKKGGEQRARIAQSKLGLKKGLGMECYLLQGIGIFFQHS